MAAAGVALLLTSLEVTPWLVLRLHVRSADSRVSRSSSRLEMLCSMHVKSFTSSKLCMACQESHNKFLSSAENPSVDHLAWVLIGTVADEPRQGGHVKLVSAPNC